MDLKTSVFKVTARKFKLSKHATDYTAGLKKDKAVAILAELKKELAYLQEVLYADDQRSVLIIFQAMDAAGKDSAIANVMSGIDPQGCQVFSFKQPSTEEYDHDFLWRHYKALPEKGRMGIHNRSHYENVLICKVHPEIILKERLSNIADVNDINDQFWKNRYNSIRNFEQHLVNNSTTIIKIFLNVSKDEQKERFLERIDDPSKNWKFSSFDVAERANWNAYMQAYEDAINETATKDAPWYVIPADKKWFTRIAVCQVIIEELKKIKSAFPVLPDAEIAKLQACKESLLKEID